MPGTACYADISDVTRITIGDWNSKKWLRVSNEIFIHQIITDSVSVRFKIR